jgi:hypothetical protein
MAYLTTPLGNNSISYNQRKALGSKCELFIPNIQTIKSIDDVQLGSEIVFEEIDHRGQLRSLTGLTALYQMGNIRIMDNHNYALFARSQMTATTIPIVPIAPILIHIDAHADLDEPLRAKDTDENRWTYTSTGITVGSFIQPAIEHHIISDCIQIRSYYALEQLAARNWPLATPLILDLDLDFRAHEDAIPTHHIQTLKQLIVPHDPLVPIATITIATSPYFLDQKKAMKFLQQLKPALQSTT